MHYLLCPRCQFKMPARKHMCSTCGYELPVEEKAPEASNQSTSKGSVWAKFLGYGEKRTEQGQEKPALS